MQKERGVLKLQFKVQQYQSEAVDAVVDVFAGQPKRDGVSHQIAWPRGLPRGGVGCLGCPGAGCRRVTDHSELMQLVTS
ncbi:MAG: hypothetical protein Q4D89_14730 [Arachnia propionica]|nr:hypothetical protein [Arachnia propionica]